MIKNGMQETMFRWKIWEGVDLENDFAKTGSNGGRLGFTTVKKICIFAWDSLMLILNQI